MFKWYTIGRYNFTKGNCTNFLGLDFSLDYVIFETTQLRIEKEKIY